jgi:hypothetical protein
MTYFITKKKHTEMLVVLVDYCDAIVKKRDKYKQKMDYYDKLMDFVTDLQGADESNSRCTSDRYLTYLALCTKYHKYKDKYELLKLRFFSLKCNIQLLISYPYVEDSL